VIAARLTRLLPPALVLVLALALGACSDDDASDDDATGDDTVDAATPDAAPGDQPDATPGNEADAAPGGGGDTYLLLTCEPGGGGGSYDAGAGEPDASTDGPDAGPPGGVDESCCDPEGACGAGLECISGLDPAVHRCRPHCDAQGACGAGGACADFGGTKVCIPASTEGQACAPELCDATTICVGSSADDATCHRRCTVTDDCEAPQTCQPLTGSAVKACF
jgi:hypothetical protein